MSLVNIVDKDTKKDIKKEKGLIDCIRYYDSSNYEQLMYNLIYAKNDEVLNRDTIHVYAREYKETLFKFILCENLEDLINFDFSNKTLKKYAANRTLDNLNVEAFEAEKEITIIVINDTNVDPNLVKKYAFLNTKHTPISYQVVFRFDNTNIVVRQYRTLPETDKLYSLYNTAIKFDLGCSTPRED